MRRTMLNLLWRYQVRKLYLVIMSGRKLSVRLAISISRRLRLRFAVLVGKRGRLVATLHVIMILMSADRTLLLDTRVVYLVALSTITLTIPCRSANLLDGRLSVLNLTLYRTWLPLIIILMIVCRVRGRTGRCRVCVLCVTRLMTMLAILRPKRATGCTRRITMPLFCWRRLRIGCKAAFLLITRPAVVPNCTLLLIALCCTITCILLRRLGVSRRLVVTSAGRIIRLCCNWRN